MLKKMFSPGPLSRIMAGLGNIVGNIPLNDPTTPNLSADLEMPSIGTLKYGVKGLTTGPRNANEVRAFNCHVSLGHCINALQALMRKPLQGWSATKMLEVDTAAGAEMNAYYDRRSLRFFYYNHRGRNVYFGDSVDIIAHELGHAFLDAMRPDFWSVQALEIWSFHEAFSDVVAVFNLLCHDTVVRSILEETGGDLRRSNHASRLAEEVGRLIRDVTQDPAYLGDALRNPAVERFHYVSPSKLPKEAPNDSLAAECHSFGRVFSAAWYEAFVRCYEHEVSQGLDRDSALRKSRDACMSTLMKAAAASPRVTNYYEAVARCAVSVAADNGDAYSRVFSDVFDEWGILAKGAVQSLSSRSWSEVVRDLGRTDTVLRTRSGALVSMRRKAFFKVEELPVLSGLSMPQGIEVDVPFDSYYEFDLNGNLVGEIAPDRDKILADASDCISQAYEDMGPNGMWEIKDGRVSRRFVR